ncbi:MAG: gamma-glutamyltranspeptidase / glutathione hydrolase [Solirubrobacteraceae bacterium]|jgi:gamma-glutamyltranspeptidase/glutathione hydrolase|nr:gamma-glutamyltranspeptidase / glutathione hydrolase [Solirubrobacteraceae bacterium]
MPSRALVSLLATIVALALAPAADAQSVPATGPATSTGSGGAAATVDRHATEAAIAVLRGGGNAVDAAVTAAAVLGVVEPFSCGIGGGGFMLSYDARKKRSTTIDHREMAAGAMRPDSFWENGKPLAFNDARYSGMSVGVPGTVAGWARALELRGSISLAEALRPAIEIAREGFVIDQTFFNQTQDNLAWFDDAPATAALFLDPDGTPRDVGTVFRNPDLARTLARIARVGARGFYRGEVAGAIVATVRRPPVAPTADHRWRAGVMDRQDLRDYRARLRARTSVRYRGLDILGMGPPSSGGSTVGEALNILEGYPLGTLPREQAMHLRLEASRLAFADRGRWVADPSFYRVPLRGLLSDGFAATRRALIGETAAKSPVAAGDPRPFDTTTRAAPRPTSATAERSGSTTHISVSDRAGNVVSYTFTIESTGGSGLVVPGYGFLLNNELTDFNYDSLTHPNRVRPHKRPRSSISPTIVMRAGRPWLTLGTPGGSTIITTVLQLLTDRIDLGMTLPQAIAAPRTSQRNTATTQAEPAFLATPEAAALQARGHVFAVAPAPEIGAANGIEFLDDGNVLAAAEPVRRGGGSAMVVSPAP